MPFMKFGDAAPLHVADFEQYRNRFLLPFMYRTKDGKTKSPSLATRLDVLKDEIQHQTNRIERGENNELVERIYLYYDGYE